MKNRSSINTFSIHHVAMMSLLMVFSYVNAEDTKKNEVGIPSDPQGEWYEVGYFMAREAAPGFRMFTIANPDASVRLTRVIETLGLDVSTVKTTDLALIQQGWDDFLAGRKQAMTYPPDQTGSLVPVPLRGFHRFTNSATGELAENAAEWKKAVVLVRSRTGHGTGFFIGPGLLLTNHHVVHDEKTVQVQLEENKTIRIHKAEVLASQEVPDVALLQIEWKANTSLPIGDSDLCKELQEVVMIGYPVVDRPAATFVKGHVSSTGDASEVDKDLSAFETIQLNIEATKGNSGGPVVATNGSVVGIHTWSVPIRAGSQFSFAQKINFILPFIEKHAKGKFQRAK